MQAAEIRGWKRTGRAATRFFRVTALEPRSGEAATRFFRVTALESRSG
ncbi:hypothetical protein B8V81_3038 [Paenibacillus pasadenensis]|uniref:Uncharacterized protein n=1 Tax=Paenibacillus pasadenensis TaxID=217090 RepID=A0A2N5N2N1_9BACL|nr:hypothetical protein B8V81_3038 [Paenibacillus pasadenensis]